MAAIIPITTDDVKNYLVISASTYDDNIAAVISLWTEAIELCIDPAYLGDSAYTPILKAGKLLILAGHVQNRLPVAAMGASTGSRVTLRIGQYEETTDTKSGSGTNNAGATGDGLINTGWETLKPYLTEEALNEGVIQIKTNNDSAVGEFTLTHRNSDGDTVGETGSMEGW
jgi:hypothetical protein